MLMEEKNIFLSKKNIKRISYLIIMRFYYIFLSLVKSEKISEKIIKNMDLPSCKNCIHYKPNILISDFTDTSNTCQNFGKKNIITDKIDYSFAYDCRSDESKCGEKGKYFEEDKYIKVKILTHQIMNKSIYFLPFLTLITSVILSIK